MTESGQYNGPGAQHPANPPGAATAPWITPGLLVLANLVPVFGVLTWGWEVSQVLLFYWSENLLVGFFNVLRILSYRQGRALLLAAFFTLHYGGFCAAHGMLLLSLFDYPMAASSDGPLGNLPLLGLLSSALNTVLAVAPPLWRWGFAALAVSHAASFLLNFLLRNERAATSPTALMSAPYQRILILHVVLIIGGLAVTALGAPLLLLMLLVVLKIAIDLRAHQRERQHRPVQAV